MTAPQTTIPATGRRPAPPADEQPRQHGVPEWLRRSREIRDRDGFVAVADTTGVVAL